MRYCYLIVVQSREAHQETRYHHQSIYRSKRLFQDQTLHRLMSHRPHQSTHPIMSDFHDQIHYLDHQALRPIIHLITDQRYYQDLHQTAFHHQTHHLTTHLINQYCLSQTAHHQLNPRSIALDPKGHQQHLGQNYL